MKPYNPQDTVIIKTLDTDAVDAMGSMICGDMLIRETPIREAGNIFTGKPGDIVTIDRTCLITKDEFIACYNRWIKEAKTEHCEWIKYDYRTICPKYHDVNQPYWRIPENMDKLKYCPYCGKEIMIESEKGGVE